MSVSVAATSPPATLLLRPGVPVVRRDAETLQVGLHPPLAVRVPDTREVRSLLDALRDGTQPGDLSPGMARTLDSLLAAGLVFPIGAEPPRRELTTTRAQFGADAVRRLAARAGHRVGIRADDESRALVTGLLSTTGLEVDDVSPSVWLVVADGPVARERIDPLVRAVAPHLVVSGGAAGRRIGPFVEPGRTACLRCVDAHEAEIDPRRPFLLEQAALAASVTTSVTASVREPVDPVLDRLALAWAVRDVCRYVEGDEPSTWSATVDLGPTDPPHLVRWLRHPHCGCAWDLLFDLP